jgi:polysaccharide export outer membrane protein
VNEGNWLHNIPVIDQDYIFVPSLENTRITVLGEVASPGSLVYQPQLTLLQAIAKTGGLKETNSRHIKVIRGGLKSPVVYNVNIKEMQLGRSMDFMLEPRDIVFVPRDPVSEWNVMIRQILPTFQLINAAAGPFGNPISTLY